MPVITLSRTPPSLLWAVAQGLGVTLTGVLVWGLIQWPTLTLRLLWDMVIPLLPAVFLVNPMLWRNVCPLATLNQWSGNRRTRPIDRDVLRGVWIAGLALLAILVPARRFLFNQDGTALAVTIAAVGGLALVAGLRYPRRSGFCNSLCPVLPVEKLYGQSPLVVMASPRCASCDLCTPAGCIDLAGGKSARQSLTGRGMAWLASPFGLFAAAFPGFIVGYFTTANGGFDIAGSTYLQVATCALGSWALVAAVVASFRLPATVALTALGAASAGLYYWFGAPGLAAAYGAPVTGPVVVRVLALSLVAVWFWRAQHSATTGATPRPVV